MNTKAKGASTMWGVILASAIVAAILVNGCRSKDSATAPSIKSGESVSVTVASPMRKSVKGSLTLNGTVHAASEVNVVAETSGKVVTVYADVGKRVSSGDVLVRIDDELKLASYKTAQASYDKSSSDFEKAKSLFEQKVISDSELQGTKLAFMKAESDLLAARRDYENARVRSPQSGVVTAKSVSVGSMLSPGAAVAHVVDGDNLKISVLVSERDVLKIRAGMGVSVESDMYPDSVFKGTVSSVSPKGDAALTFPVEIALKSEANNPLYDGMSARARIDIGAKNILSLPRSALVGSRESPQVFVVRDGIARLADISTGSEYGTDIEILKGLGVDDRVVVAGQNNLADGSIVFEAEGDAQ